MLAEPWLWALLGIFGAATIAILVGPAPAIACWVTQSAFYVVFVALSWRLARQRKRSRRSRRFWRAATVSGVIFLAAAVLRTVDEIVAPGWHSTAWTAPSALFTVGSAWLLAFMLTGNPKQSGPERRVMWLDASTVLVGAAVFIWTIALTGEMGADRAEDAVWTGIGAIVLLLSAFAVTHLLVTGVAPFAAATGVVVGLGAALHGLERALNPQVMDADDGLPVLVARLVPPLLLAVAPCLERLLPSRVRALGGRRSRLIAPLVALGATQVLLIAQLSDEGLTARSWGTAMGTVAIAGLIIIRQDLLLIENARLVGRLDQTVDTVGRRERWFRSLVEHASDVTLVLDRQGRHHVRDARPATGARREPVGRGRPAGRRPDPPGRPRAPAGPPAAHARRLGGAPSRTSSKRAAPTAPPSG